MTFDAKKLQQNAARALNNQHAAATSVSATKTTLYGTTMPTAVAPMATGPNYPQACAPRRCQPNPCDGVEWWRIQCWAAKFFAELVGVFFIMLAAGIRDLYVFAGLPDPGFVVQAAAIALVATGLRFAFVHFHAGHFNPAYTFMQWCCDRKRWDWYVIGDHLLIWIGQFVGFLLGAWLLSAVTPPALSCTVILPALGNGLGTLFEGLGTLVLIHVFVLAVHRRTSGMTGIIGLGFAELSLIAVFSPITGGSLNFFRSLGVALVLGGTCNDSLGYYIAATVAAIVLAVLLLMFIFPQKCANSGNTVTIEVPPPQVVCDDAEGKLY